MATAFRLFRFENTILLAAVVMVSFSWLPPGTQQAHAQSPTPADYRAARARDAALMSDRLGAKHVHWVQVVGEGPLWHRLTGLPEQSSGTPYYINTGLLVTNARYAKKLIRLLRYEAPPDPQVMRFEWQGGDVGLCITDNPVSKARPRSDDTVRIDPEVSATYMVTPIESIVDYTPSSNASRLSKSRAGLFEAFVRSLARDAARRRRGVRTFRYHADEIRAS